MSEKPLYSNYELKQMLFSKDTKEQGTAARRIWTDWQLINDKNEINQLEKRILELFQNNTDERNSWHFMIVLGLINSVDAIDLIFDKLINSKDENIRGFAAEAFSRYSKDILPWEIYEKLWGLIENDPSLVVRVNSVRAVSQPFINTKDKDISIKLLKILDGQSHSAVKNTILQQIGDIGSLIVVPDLIHMLITRRTEVDKKMAGIALDKMARIHNYESREKLIKGFKSLDFDSKE